MARVLITFILTAAAVVVALGALYKALSVVGRKYRVAKQYTVNFIDAVTGTEAIIDPDTGAVLKEATLGINTRVAVIEQWQVDTVKTLQQIADTQQQIVALERRQQTLLKQIEDHHKAHLEWIAEHEHEVQTVHGELWDAIRQHTH